MKHPQIADNLTDALEQLAWHAKQMFDKHSARNNILHQNTNPTTEAAYIFGVCSALTQVAVATARADKSNDALCRLPFKIDLLDAVKKYKAALKLEKTLKDEEPQYIQITMDDILDMIKAKQKKNKQNKE